MLKQIIDISEAAYLHVKNSQLLIDQQGVTTGQVSIEDLGVLILQNPAIVVTQRLIIACQQSKVVIVFCDEKHLPYSVILPVAEGNTLHSKILREQVLISEPVRKRLWQQIIQQKIKQQALTLSLLGRDATRLNYLARTVKTGDRGNSEAVAAQAYWRLLFGNDFRRDIELGGINSLLNYGYAIVRAMVARSVCSAGLHPTLGLFHKNQYNALCLADDLMEPFRPWVDFLVFKLAKQGVLDINRQSKQQLLELLSQTTIYVDKKMPFMVATHYFMANLKRCYSKEEKDLYYPELDSRVRE